MLHSVAVGEDPMMSQRTCHILRHRQPPVKAGVCRARQSGPSLELLGNVVQENPDDKEQQKKGREKHLKLDQEDGQVRKRVFSDEHKAKLRAAWERRPRRFTDETKAKMVAAWKKRPRQFSDVTREKMRLAALGRQHSILTRSKMSQAHLGRKKDEDHKLMISQAQKRSWEKRKQQRASKQEHETAQNGNESRSVKTKAGTRVLQAQWEDEQLSREAAVLELISLRREVGHIVAELSMKGELPETAEEVGLHPAVHRKLWRYVWLLDQVRSAPLM
ncbi:g6202 [Coccomyxa elongata]